MEGARGGARAAVGVGVPPFGHGWLGFDDAGRPATPVYMYSDTRSAGAVDELRQRLDEAGVRAPTGCPLHSSHWPAKLAWLARAAPPPVSSRWRPGRQLRAARWRLAA